LGKEKKGRKIVGIGKKQEKQKKKGCTRMGLRTILEEGECVRLSGSKEN
jgi:hypothetical protein